MEASEITREKRLRRAAARQGLRLSKSARRDPRAKDYGKYRVENPGRVEGDYSLSLDEVERILYGHGRPLRRDEDYENAITPHAPHDGQWLPHGES